MSGGSWLKKSELAEARRLYLEENKSWAEVAKILRRNATNLQHRLAKEISRSRSEAQHARHRKSQEIGPRLLTTEADRKLYQKLRYQVGYSREQSMQMILGESR